MTPSPTDHNNKETTSKVKEEVPRMNTTTPSPQRLEQALEGFVRGLEGLEGALLTFERLLEFVLELEEGTLNGGSAPKHQDNQDLRLLSPEEVCGELEADRGSVYRMLSSGEVPSLRLGRAVKVRWADLKEYIQDQRRYQCSPGAGNGSAEPS